MMPNKILDQTNLEESFFFCEYAKRRFEMSDCNDGNIETFINFVGIILKNIFKTNIPEGMKIDFLSDIIFCHESYMIGLQYVPAFEGCEKYINSFASKFDIEHFLSLSNRFKMSAAILPFPYDMFEIATCAKRGKKIPQAFKMLNVDRRCVIILHPTQNYVFFGVDKGISLDETIDLLKKQVALFKSKNDYENSSQKDTIKKIHKRSNLNTHRQSLHNVFYKSVGLLIYDLYIFNDFNLDRALEEYRKFSSPEKCDPAQKATSEDCAACASFAKCASMLRKQFNAAVEQISGTEKNEDYLSRIKNRDQKKQLERRPISFFEYDFYGTAPSI